MSKKLMRIKLPLKTVMKLRFPAFALCQSKGGNLTLIDWFGTKFSCN